MKHLFYSKLILFSILAIGICLLAILCAGLYLSNPSQDRNNCGERILSKVPVYPNSLSLDEENLSSISSTGTVTFVYETPDTFEEVRSFYEDYSACSETFFKDFDGDVVCTGGVLGNFYSYYRVEIKQQSEITQYTLYIEWNCGVLD